VSKLSQCCCDCCITEEEMTWDAVTLKAPHETCNGVSEPPTYPSASFQRRSCCYVAEFDLSCQEWQYDCHLWVKQNFELSYDASVYRVKTAYVSTVPTTDCPCIHTENISYSQSQVVRLYIVNRRKLKKLIVTVGKVLVKCTGDAEPTCKYYVASTWVFDANLDYIGGLGLFYPSYATTTISCTGVYRDGFCSVTNEETTTNGSASDACPENMAQDWFATNTGIAYEFKVSRIKLYDALPANPVSITDADEPPVSCCGGETGCELQIDPCGLNFVDNCYRPIPDWAGVNLNPGGFCTSFDEDDNLLVTCPSILSKTGVTIKSRAYLTDAFGCSSTCVGDPDYLCENDYPGNDQLFCGYTLDENGNQVPIIINSVSAGSCGTPAEFCTVEGCASAGGDCYVYTSPNCNTNPALSDCPDLSVNNDSGGVPCRSDLSNLDCTIGDPVVYDDWTICFTLPTVTLEFA
jgi:hypothetical protein